MGDKYAIPGWGMVDARERSRLAGIYGNLRERLLDLSLRNPMLNFQHRATSKRQLQIIDTVLEQVYQKLVAEDLSLELVPLPDLDVVPADERSEEFIAALAHAKASDLEYLTKLKALESTGRDDEFASAEAERELRDRLREQLGLPPRPTRKTINPAEHAREQNIDPSYELQPKSNKSERLGRRLQTLKWDETLDAIMEKISDGARLAEQEMGLSTLFLVFGFLEWYEAADSSKKNFAPLLLLPVAVNKRKNNKGKIIYSISASAESADTNLSLRRRVYKDFNRALPDFEQKDEEVGSIEDYLQAVMKVIGGLPNWKVRRWLTLGHFSFGQFAMYADLDPENWPKHPVEDALVGPILSGTEVVGDGGGSILSPPDDYPIDDPEVERLTPILIQDADASQHSALVDVMKRMNLVIQGPPGTGKSQTITNIIANALAQNKTVLFLAEKQAALDVVKRRLDKAGLGEFCLELHSGKAIPRQVVESLKNRHKLGYETPRRAPNPMSADITWEKSRRAIAQYLGSLHAEESDGETPFSLIWQSLRARTNLGQAIENFRAIDVPSSLIENPSDYAAAKGEVSLYARMLETFYSTFGVVASSPWYSVEFSEKAGLSVTSGLFEDLGVLRTSARAVTARIQQAGDFGVTGLGELKKLVELDRILPLTTPPADLVIRISKLSAHEVEHLIEFKKTLDQLRERARQLPDLSTLDSDQLQQIDEFARSTSTANVSDMSPNSAKLWAHKKIAACDALEPVLGVFLSAADTLCLARSFPANAVESLYMAIIIAGKLTKEYLVFFRWTPVDGMDAFNSARSEWLALVNAERQWRTKYPNRLLGNKWPTPAELMTVANLLRRGMVGKIFDKISGDSKYIGALGEKLGLASGLVPLADDLQELAIHEQARSTFLLNKTYQKTLGPWWKGFDTPFEQISRVFSFRNRCKELLLERAGGDEVFKQLLSLDNEGFARLVDSASAAEQYKNLSADLRTEFSDASIENLLNELRSTAAHARIILNSDLNGHLDRFQDSTARLQEAARAEIRRRRAEADFGAQELSRTDCDLVRDDAAIAQTRDTLTWIAAVRSADAPAAVGLLSNNIELVRRRLATTTAAAKTEIDALYSSVSNINAHYDVHGFDAESPSELATKLDGLLSRRDELTEFLGLVDQRRVLEGRGLGPFVHQFERHNLSPSQMVDFFTGTVAHRRAEKARRTNPVLSKVSGVQLSAKRREFVDRDYQKIEADRKIVRNALISTKPPIGSREGPRKKWTQMELLLNEFGKEKRFCPVRDLMTRASNAVQRMKPCFMMSPLSLAKFLPPNGLRFDLLVVDEASQMRPEDALGGLLRAGQVIVVGDQKQLPPTDFFHRSEESMSSSDDDSFDDIDDESILEVCQKTFRQVRMLRWHYRSRCESLIAFCNKEFYHNELITFPTARPNSFSVDVVKVGGNYEAHRNPAEAQRIAEEAIRFMRHFAEMEEESIPTLGLVAINGDQRDLISEELRRLESGDSLVETYREKVAAKGEPVFVKNLENVQGDERDFIFISMTYGPKPGHKEVLQRFGPINGKQGHRRLNVLFTRARIRIVIFASMTADDVKPVQTSSEGLRVLKRYLEYAEDRGRAPAEGVGASADSDFEIEVADRLRLHGFTVEPQVGVSGFKIDLGIRHPDHPEKFLVGIECDGATYHSSRSARDRDRLREQVLRGLGWEILRVWSTDWFDNPDFQTQRLVKQVEELRKRPVEPYEDYSVASSYATASAKVDQEQDEILTVTEPQASPSNAFDHNVSQFDATNLQKDDAFARSGVPTSDQFRSSLQSDVAQILRQFRDGVIAVEMENWQPHRSILRDSMIETLVAQKVRNPDDWFLKVPQFQRAGTNAVEKRRYFERICEIIDHINEGSDPKFKNALPLELRSASRLSGDFPLGDPTLR